MKANFRKGHHLIISNRLSGNTNRKTSLAHDSPRTHRKSKEVEIMPVLEILELNESDALIINKEQ
jgi:hypothetical protein